MKRVWLALCFVGTAAPLAAIAPWVGRHGLDPGLLAREASSSPVAAFAWLDVLVSALAVLALAARRVRRGERRFLWVIAGTSAVGVSLGLPLYLLLAADEPAAA